MSMIHDCSSKVASSNFSTESGPRLDYKIKRYLERNFFLIVYLKHGGMHHGLQMSYKPRNDTILLEIYQQTLHTEGS